MANKYQSTEAQRRYILALSDWMSDEQWCEMFAEYAKRNQNQPTTLITETRNQALKRLTKRVCSAMIDELK
ncbi:hypothetical protein QP400_00495 [Winkia sp. UMB3158]|uniref:Phage protein n=3 Tax=Bacillati TaxID=1783272 RepID=A0AAW6Y104_STRAG|nr:MULTISPECIES: hypothetical protein [Terrabacteria group]MDK8341199.1 hypothetical protein [Winkia sp. UMB3164B]OFT55910.1 hypothetical protein HMPREF3152_04465 [Actinomyces sp. HMSC06A08]MDK6240153.1 hypothetical protein [Winkia sp. UMB10116]MDK6471397.1 hypothetical protein [Streptococcus agalactiae]MDK6900365.1 hypothetical protein [Streptococcus agalactiae]